jgi:hypothetical protein
VLRRPLALDTIALVALTAVAAYLRFYDLAEFPFGLRGDEATVGILSRLIKSEGWIGPYTVEQAGFPVGPLYFYSIFIDRIDNGVLAVRFGPALLGTATVPVFYIAIRQFASIRVAVCAATLLAVSHWHIALSRIAFPAIGWPLMEVVAIACLVAGMRTRRWWWYLGAGLAAGCCWYTYQAGWLFLVALGGFFVLRVVTVAGVARVQEVMLWGILAGGALLASWEMIEYARDPANRFGDHARGLAVTRTTEYKELDGLSAKVEFWAEREIDYVQSLAWEATPEKATGIGIEPPVSKVLLLLIAAGAVIALWRWRTTPYLLPIVMIPVLTLGAVLTVGDPYRRSFGALPAMLLLAGLALGWAWERADRWPLVARIPTVAAVAALLGFIAFGEVDRHFNAYRDGLRPTSAFLPEATSAAQRMRTLPEETQWYFLTGLTPSGHEVYDYLFADPQALRRKDRSREFGLYGVQLEETQGPVGFAFFDGYVNDVALVVPRYPDGRLLERPDGDTYMYRLFYLPPGPIATRPPEPLAPLDAMRPGEQQLAEHVSVSCAPTQPPPRFAFYPYRPEHDTFALFARADAAPSGGVMAAWRFADGVLQQVGCANSPAYVIPEKPPGPLELGIEATGGAVYYVGIAINAPGLSPAALVWDVERSAVATE